MFESDPSHVQARLDSSRFARAKKAFTTRRVPIEDMHFLLTGSRSPESGDLVLARVEAIGKHRRIELTNGRRAFLFPGDEVIVCYGNRYAPDQYEAVVPDNLGGCDLVASGGVAAREQSRRDRLSDPTRITPIGLIADASRTRLNLSDYAVPIEAATAPITVILVVGTSMNSGKTLTGASLVRGFQSQGYNVAAIKITGTGAGGDVWIMQDVGADLALDFTDAGFASTYKAPIREIEEASINLIHHAANAGCRIAVIEIADGLQQYETAALLRSKRLRLHASGTVFAGYDSMGAKSGVDILKSLGHRVIAVSGRLTRSPLMIREALHATGTSVFTPREIMNGAVARLMSDELEPRLVARSTQTSSERVWAQSAESGIESSTKDDEPGSALSNSLLGLFANQLMEFEVDVLCGAPRGQRRTGRRNRRSGYRDLRWETDLGNVDIRIPKLRRGRYRPEFLDCSDPKGDAVAAVLRETLAGAVSTRSLRDLVRAMGVTGLPETQLLQLGAAIEEWTECLDLGQTTHGISNTQGAWAQPSQVENLYAIEDDYEFETRDGEIGG